MKLLGDLPNTHWRPTGTSLFETAAITLRKVFLPSTNETVQECNLSDFDVVHCPVYLDEKKQCVVCVKERRGCKFVYSSCSTSKCQGLHKHITKDLNCYQVYHTRQFHNSK